MHEEGRRIWIAYSIATLNLQHWSSICTLQKMSFAGRISLRLVCCPHAKRKAPELGIFVPAATRRLQPMTHASPIFFLQLCHCRCCSGRITVSRPNHFLQGRIQTRRPWSTPRAWLNPGTKASSGGPWSYSNGSSPHYELLVSSPSQSISIFLKEPKFPLFFMCFRCTLL
jgi:hypothetical protein